MDEKKRMPQLTLKYKNKTQKRRKKKYILSYRSQINAITKHAQKCAV